jgi:hypothetical protein
MKNNIWKYIVGFSLLGLILAVPFVAAQATQIFQGLASPAAQALYSNGVRAVVIGAGDIVSGFAVWRTGAKSWFVVKTQYNQIDSHAYALHGTEFGKLTKTQFEDKCKKNQNNLKNTQYWQMENNRIIAHDASSGMVTVGDTDGKFVVTCYKADMNYVLRQIATGRWIKFAR